MINPPKEEPVTLADFMAWMQGLPISAEQEPMAQSLLKAGREEAEAYQNVAYCEQTLQVAPNGFSGAIVLPRPPFRALQSVVVYAPDDTSTDVTDLFTVNDAVRPAELRLKDGARIPGTFRIANPMVVTYTAGYDKVPGKVKQAILLYAAWAWMHRGGDEPIPAAFYALLSKGRVVPV